MVWKQVCLGLEGQEASCLTANYTLQSARQMVGAQATLGPRPSASVQAVPRDDAHYQKYQPTKLGL